MMKLNVLSTLKKVTLSLIVLVTLIQCTEEEILPAQISPEEDLTIRATAFMTSCNCHYIVPATATVVDAKALGLGPGSIIGLNAAYAYKSILFKNLVGTATQPIIIKNFNGTATLTATGRSYGIRTERSQYFRITGGNISKSYGIRINGGHQGISLDNLSTNFEVDHLEVYNSGFAGIMAKTDPSCDIYTTRGYFTMRDVSLHDNYIHDTAGEGFYIGNSFYHTGVNTACGLKYPHEIHNLKVYNNVVRNTGWEGIQVGCATRGAMVYNNSVENYGKANIKDQNNGVQLGAGTGGLFYNNYIKSGTGNGLIVLGLGDNVVHDNVIAYAGAAGIFCDERVTPGPGFKFINNTIINPKTDGIRIYADLVPMNVIINNIIVNPGAYSTYQYPRTGNDAYIFKLSSTVRLQSSNNYLTRDINAVKFASPYAFNYRLTSASPAVNKGTSISTYNIATDHYLTARLKGAAYDIGASEY